MATDDTKYFIDKLPTITTRTVPENWDPIEESKALKSDIKVWGRITSKICQSLWSARAVLSSPGKRTDLNLNGEDLTFESFCTLSGVHPRTARRWLERYDPLTETIIEPKPPLVQITEESVEPNNYENGRTSSPTTEETDGIIPSINNTYLDSLSVALTELNHPDNHKNLNEIDATQAVVMFERIIKKATRLRNELRNRFAVNTKSQLEKDLFSAAKESFASKNSFDLNWKLEVPKLWKLVELSMKAEEPPAFLETFVTTAWELTNSNEKFWKDKPFVPSAFITEKMIPIMLKAIDNRGDNQVKAEILSDIKEIFS